MNKHGANWVWDPKEAMIVSGAHEMNGPLDIPADQQLRRPTCFKDLAHAQNREDTFQPHAASSTAAAIYGQTLSTCSRMLFP